MTNSEFKLWLKGYFSLSDESYIDNKQVSIIQNHADLVATVEPVEDHVNNFINFLTSNISEYGQVCFEKAKSYLQS